MASGLDGITVRPTLLTATPATRKITTTVDLSDVHGAKIARAKVARFVIEQTSEDRWLRSTPLITSA